MTWMTPFGFDVRLDLVASVTVTPPLTAMLSTALDRLLRLPCVIWADVIRPDDV